MKTDKHFFTFLFLMTCVAGMSFSVMSCKDDEETSSSRYVSGTLSFSFDDYYAIGTSATLTAVTDITSPSMDSVQLIWVGSSFNPNMKVNDSTFTTLCPATPGSYSISLVASAIDYMNLSTTNTTTLIPASFFEAITDLKATSDTLTDLRDGNRYPHKIIGNRDWFVSNLNWAGAGRPYKDQAGYGIILGRLYSWHEAVSGDSAATESSTVTANGVCPTGWRVPSNTDWEDLGKALNNDIAVQFTDDWNDLGKYAAAAGKLQDGTSTGTLLWDGLNQSTTRTNTLGWNALPTGKISGNTSTDKSSYGYWWSATEKNTEEGYFRYIIANDAKFRWADADKTGAHFAVRCVRD